MKKSTVLFTILSLMIAFTGCKKPHKNFVVTFDSNGGSEVVIQNIAEGQKVTKPSPNPTKEEYVFDGWYKDNNTFNEEWDFANDIVDKDITLFAKWSIILPPDNFSVTFNSNGGSNVDAQIVIEGDKAKKPSPDPTKEGNLFGGWYKDNNTFKNEWNFETVITENVTLHAKWTVIPTNSYVVTFDSNGGSDVGAQIVTKGDKAKKPAAPTKAGHTFVNWFTAGDNEWSFETAITEDITLFAKWSINEYTVTFDSNGGSDVDSQSIEYDNPAEEPVTPTKIDVLFAGWYKDNYTFNNKWNFETDVVTADITLYAKWSEAVTVTFNSNGGTSVDPQTVAVGSQVTEPTVEKPGNIFAGWFSDGTFTSEISFPYTVPSSITLHAKWLIIGTGAWNEIRTAAELNAVRNYLSGQYILMEDISLAEYDNWEPIGGVTPFAGKFDGNNKKITNLSINRPSAEYVGLFGHINDGGTIKDLGVEIGAGGVKGGMYAGGIAGYIGDDNTITGCYSTGSITSSSSVTYSRSGGIAGYIKSGTITSCYSTAYITATNTNSTFGVAYSGGIAGDIAGKIINCYSTGDIEATARNTTHSGGIAGRITGEIENSYSRGAIYSASSLAYSGGIAGSGTINNCAAINSAINSTNTSTYTGRIAGSGAASNNFALVDMEAQGDAIFSTDPEYIMFHGVDKTDAELKIQTTYSDPIIEDGLGGLGWDFTDTWKMPSGSGYPILFWQE